LGSEVQDPKTGSSLVTKGLWSERRLLKD